MNQHPELKVQAQFGTLRDYFDAVARDARQQPSTPFTTLAGDFFSYADRKDNYWTGQQAKDR